MEESCSNSLSALSESTCPASEELTILNGWRHAFQKLEQVKTPSPLIKKLQEYQERIKQDHVAFQQPSRMSPGLAEYYLDGIEDIGPREVAAGFNSTLLRLRHETNYFGSGAVEMKDNNVIDILLSANLGKDERARFVPFFWLNWYLIKRGFDGGYFPAIGRVIITHKLPTPREMWKMLATQGVLPEIISTLNHELVHHTQYSLLQRLVAYYSQLISPGVFGLIFSKYGLEVAIPPTATTVALIYYGLSKLARNDEILGEIHVYNAAINSPFFSHHKLDKVEKIINHVASLYRSKPFALSKALEGYILIQRLRLLGANDKKIGHLVQMARWSSKEQTYPRLQKAIDKQFKYWGIEEPETQKIVLNALQAKHDLELYINRYRARIIAAEELEIAAGRWRRSK